MARLSGPAGPGENIELTTPGIALTFSHKLSDLLHSGELSLLVGDPDPGDGVDGDPVAAVPVVRLQLLQVGGVTRVGFPADTADLQEIRSVRQVVVRQFSPQNNLSHRIFQNIFQTVELLKLLGTDLVHIVF